MHLHGSLKSHQVLSSLSVILILKMDFVFPIYITKLGSNVYMRNGLKQSYQFLISSWTVTCNLIKNLVQKNIPYFL